MNFWVFPMSYSNPPMIYPIISPMRGFYRSLINRSDMKVLPKPIWSELEKDEHDFDLRTRDFVTLRNRIRAPGFPGPRTRTPASSKLWTLAFAYFWSQLSGADNFLVLEFRVPSVPDEFPLAFRLLLIRFMKDFRIWISALSTISIQRTR